MEDIKKAINDLYDHNKNWIEITGGDVFLDNAPIPMAVMLMMEENVLLRNMLKSWHEIELLRTEQIKAMFA